MNKQKEEAFQQIMDYARKLKNQSLDLRSKLTSLVLYTEDVDDVSQEEKNCVLSICEIIAKKNNELIFTEEKLEEVIQQLTKGESVNSHNYSHFNH
ncbi:hypothetical protein LVD15_17175 [Fulvivirga maritima]|uniref:hypothetical protein n=1 Tax=Fulvivirga maritima TaxID=2904247 RepID=UPI001F24A81C|nr:hypothetical protein [Fulvivirga maritima]UII25033.1 hypothetical protein LVD15_17175 [Fulvivirga maritima]